MRETTAEKEERLLEVALTFTQPFTIEDVCRGPGVSPDYQVASRMLARLWERGDLRNLAGTKVHDRWLPARPYVYEWVND